jgi:hypothetical protein
VDLEVEAGTGFWAEALTAGRAVFGVEAGGAALWGAATAVAAAVGVRGSPATAGAGGCGAAASATLPSLVETVTFLLQPAPKNARATRKTHAIKALVLSTAYPLADSSGCRNAARLDTMPARGILAGAHPTGSTVPGYRPGRGADSSEAV